MTFFLPLLLLLLLGLTSAAPVDSGAPTSVTSYNGPMTPELIKAWSAKQKFVGDVGAVSNADDPSFKWKNCWKTDVKGSVKDMRDAIARYCKEAEGVVLKKNNVFLSTFKYAGYGVMVGYHCIGGDGWVVRKDECVQWTSSIVEGCSYSSTFPDTHFGGWKDVSSGKIVVDPNPL